MPIFFTLPLNPSPVMFHPSLLLKRTLFLKNAIIGGKLPALGSLEAFHTQHSTIREKWCQCTITTLISPALSIIRSRPRRSRNLQLVRRLHSAEVAADRISG